MQITIETKRTHASVQQCHRCQRFGHNHFGCKMAPRCHKCAADHFFTDCQKPRTLPAKCCNCGEAHPANASICAKRPGNTQRRTENNQQKTANTPPRTFSSKPRNDSITTYATQAQTTQVNPDTNHLLAIVRQMNEATKALTAYFTTGINVQP